MADLLSTEQVLLLENLMYLTNKGGLNSVSTDDGTVAGLLNKIDVDALSNDTDFGSTYMNADDWRNIINAVKNDPDLMKMEIAATNYDNTETGGGGFSAVFVNPDSGEAVVAFRGTAGGEWKDDFVGGYQTDTAQQQNALDWYQQVYDELGLDEYTVTITGHSKGGNKAKYITILDDTVDRCISFDGQGFSDEFMEKYADQIAERQGVISNNNVDYDYVNLILNDVGETTWYDGQDYGEGGFLENHCPNTFLKFNEDGTYSTVQVDSQAPEMKKLDEFLNSYLRSLSPEDKAAALEFMGTLVEMGFAIDGDMSPNDILDLFREMAMDPDNEEMIANLLAYLIKYEQENPEFKDAINSVLEEFGLSGVTDIVDMIDGVLNWEYFDKLMDVLDWAEGKIPNWLLEKLSEYLFENYGIKLSAEELRQLLSMIGMLNSDLQEIEIDSNSGADIVIDSSSFGSVGEIKVDFAVLSHFEEEVRAYADKVSELHDRIEELQSQMKFSTFGLNLYISLLKKELSNRKSSLQKMAFIVEKIRIGYSNAETKITNSMQ